MNIGNKCTNFHYQKKINCNGNLIDFCNPLVMGILNLTPDSFFDGGKYQTDWAVLTRVEEMLAEGATFIDLGAMSTRPGAEIISEQEEWDRLEKALKSIRKQFPEIFISIDTFRASIARRCIEEYNVCMINDISAGRFDDRMYDTVAELNTPYCIMHMKEVPKKMQDNPQYDDVVQEVLLYFANIIKTLKYKGINNVIIDPGFGFAKTIEHNYTLLTNLAKFGIFNLPILVGISRKSMIYKAIDATPYTALNGTTAAHAVALMQGADILRVHDVKEAIEAIKIIQQCKNVE